jgi:hypothetical protein
MNTRQHTIVCIFDTRSPRITALQVHEWIYKHLKLPEDEVRMIQIDGPGRKVFIKFHNETQAQNLLQSTKGQMQYQHENGEWYNVYIEHAGMGTKRIRIANLPPEIPNNNIRDTLATYGEVLEIVEENWSKTYRYAVSNGIRVAITRLKKHIPSNLVIAGNKVIITYENQPMTCYGCNDIGHQTHECPKRRLTYEQQTQRTKTTWADVLTNRIPQQHKIITQNNQTAGDNTIPDDLPETMHTQNPTIEHHIVDNIKQDKTGGKNCRTENYKEEAEKRQHTATSTRDDTGNNKIHEHNMDNNIQEEDNTTIHNAEGKTTGTTNRETEYKQQVNDCDNNSSKDTKCPTPMEEEYTKTIGQHSPKRNKKLKTDRETQINTERTRSKSRNMRTATNVI